MIYKCSFPILIFFALCILLPFNTILNLISFHLLWPQTDWVSFLFISNFEGCGIVRGFTFLCIIIYLCVFPLLASNEIMYIKCFRKSK